MREQYNLQLCQRDNVIQNLRMVIQNRVAALHFHRHLGDCMRHAAIEELHADGRRQNVLARARSLPLRFCPIRACKVTICIICFKTKVNNADCQLKMANEQFSTLVADAFQNPPFCCFATFGHQECLDKTICHHFDKKYFRLCYITVDGRETNTSQTIGKGTDFGTDPESFSA